jgi:hypothetical protein
MGNHALVGVQLRSATVTFGRKAMELPGGC